MNHNNCTFFEVLAMSAFKSFDSTINTLTNTSSIFRLEGGGRTGLFLPQTLQTNIDLHTRWPMFETSQREAFCDAWKAPPQTPLGELTALPQTP